MPTGIYQRKPRVQRLSFKCQNCGGEILISPGRLRSRGRTPKFCSHKCNGNKRIKPATRVSMNCDGCGNQFMKRRDHVTKSNFCSRACSNKRLRIEGARWRDKAQIRAYMRDYTKNHPEKALEALRRRRALKRGQYGRVTAAEWEALCSLYGNKCLCCGQVGPLTMDHVIPLTLGGPHLATNIQPLCINCNRRKYTKIIDYRPTAAAQCVEATYPGVTIALVKVRG